MNNKRRNVTLMRFIAHSDPRNYRNEFLVNSYKEKIFTSSRYFIF